MAPVLSAYLADQLHRAERTREPIRRTGQTLALQARQLLAGRPWDPTAIDVLADVVAELPAAFEISALGLDHLERVMALLEDWTLALASTSVKARVALLLGHLLGWRGLATKDTDGSETGLWPAICAEVADSGVAPGAVVAHLDLRALSWERAETKADADTIPISTIHEFKGGAQRVIIGYHDERVPPSARPSAYEDLDPDEVAAEGLALAYVEASRAEDVHLSLCIKRPGCYHHPPLAGWEYLQRR